MLLIPNTVSKSDYLGLLIRTPVNLVQSDILSLNKNVCFIILCEQCIMNIMFIFYARKISKNYTGWSEMNWPIIRLNVLDNTSNLQ